MNGIMNMQLILGAEMRVAWRPALAASGAVTCVPDLHPPRLRLDCYRQFHIISVVVYCAQKGTSGVFSTTESGLLAPRQASAMIAQATPSHSQHKMGPDS